MFALLALCAIAIGLASKLFEVLPSNVIAFNEVASVTWSSP